MGSRRKVTLPPHVTTCLPDFKKIVRTEDYFALSTPMTGHMSKFALLCQAARLLGQVLQHVSSSSALQDDDLWTQLERTLQSMLTASLNVETPDHDQITLIYRFALHVLIFLSVTISLLTRIQCSRCALHHLARLQQCKHHQHRPFTPRKKTHRRNYPDNDYKHDSARMLCRT